MSSSSAVYSHRPMQPSGVRVHPQPSQDSPPFSIHDPIDRIKQMFDGVHEELARERSQKDAMEAKLNSQVSELNSIRRALFELEGEHSRVCQHYEDELHRLRSEPVPLVVRRSPPPPPPTHRSPPALGIPARARGPGLSDPSSSSFHETAQQQQQLHPHHPRTQQPQYSQQQQQHRSLSRGTGTMPLADRDFEQGDKKRATSADGDLDRLSDHRESKRHKARRDVHPDVYPPPPMGAHSHSYSHSHSPQQPHASGSGSGSGSGSSGLKPSSYNNNHLAQYRFPGHDSAGPPSGSNSASSSSIPPPNATPPRDDPMSPQNVPPEFRKEGADWSVLYNPKLRKSLDVNLVHNFVHASVVCCVQFSADGRYLATGCNRTTQIFDVQSGNKVCVLEDETASKTRDLYIRSVRFSPDGKLLATGAEDSKIRVWDLAKRRVRHTFDGHNQEIYSLDFSRDGRHIVSGSGDRTMRIWDVVDPSCSRTITIHDADGGAPNNTNNTNHTTNNTNANTNTNATTNTTNNDADAGVTSVAISPDGALVAAGSLDSPVRVWDVASGTLLERLRGHGDSVYCVAFTADGRGVVSGSLDRTLKYWDVSALVERRRNLRGGKMDSKAGGGEAGSGSGSGSGSRSPQALAVSPPSPATLNFVGHKDYVLSVSISEDNRWVVSGSKDRTVHFWDAKTSEPQFILHGHKNSVISLDLNPLGGMLATGSGDCTARIWTYSSTSPPPPPSHSFNS